MPLKRAARAPFRCGSVVAVGLSRVCLLLLLPAAWLMPPSLAAGLGVENFTCMVPMRDGTRLATDVYLPHHRRQGAYPIVLVRTPDGKNEVTRQVARYVSRHGFGLVAQDTRGRHCSPGGPTMIFFDDGWGPNQDGHDTLQWIACQPWCDGRVGAWGVSAMGVTANMLAPDAPPVLRAEHVMMAFSDMYSQAAYQGGVLRKSLVECWLQEHHYDPINLQTVLAHPRYDEFWAQLNADAQAERVNVPGVFWGGWYDVFLQGTINSFVTIHNQGGPGARGKCRLIIGPWNHQDAEWLVQPQAAGCSPQAADPLRFFAYWLQGVPNGVPCDAAVYYYVMGDPCGPGNFWRSCGNWPPPATATNYYLHADGTLRPQPPAAADASRSYAFDPHNPVPTVGGLNMYGSWGPMDQRGIETRDDVLLFSSEPLAQPVEVTGPISVELFISSDAPDTDFTAKLTDVYPDGRSLLLCDGILRARFRESFQRDELLEPGKVYRLNIDLWSTSVIFNRGHRIRVAISSSNCPRFEPNPNTGLLPPEAKETRIATNTVHLSQQYPSHIILPLAGVRGQGTGDRD